MTFPLTIQTGDGIPQIYNEIVNTVLLAVVFQSHQKFYARSDAPENVRLSTRLDLVE